MKEIIEGYVRPHNFRRDEWEENMQRHWIEMCCILGDDNVKKENKELGIGFDEKKIQPPNLCLSSVLWTAT